MTGEIKHVAMKKDKISLEVIKKDTSLPKFIGYFGSSCS